MKAGYMDAIFLYVTTKIFLAIRGGPYMTPIFPNAPLGQLVTAYAGLSLSDQPVLLEQQSVNTEGLLGDNSKICLLPFCGGLIILGNVGRASMKYFYG